MNDRTLSLKPHTTYQAECSYISTIKESDSRLCHRVYDTLSIHPHPSLLDASALLPPTPTPPPSGSFEWRQCCQQSREKCIDIFCPYLWLRYCPHVIDFCSQFVQTGREIRYRQTCGRPIGHYAVIDFCSQLDRTGRWAAE